MIYFDYSANTPVAPSVITKFAETEGRYTGNPNSSHETGRRAQALFSAATSSIAGLLQIQPEEIIYTSGASEANNLSIKGIARAYRHYGKHIISTPLEHPSVTGPLTWLKENGFEIDLVHINRDGTIDLENLDELLRNDTILVAVSAVDSELGVVQPVKEIAELIRKKKKVQERSAQMPSSDETPTCFLHVDATQAIGKIPFSFAGADTVSLSAHKFYGLNGSGLLFKQKDLVLDPLIHGGAGASLYRSGTPTLALTVALEEALSLSLSQLQTRYAQIDEANAYLRRELEKQKTVRINSPATALPHILNLSVKGIKGDAMQKMLDEKGICVSVKSACSVPGTPSRAVYAVTHDRQAALSSFRISLSHLTTRQELDAFLAAIKEICPAG